MSANLTDYKDDVTRVFGLCVDILSVARSLKSISMDIKLLAYNGIVQAARIGSEQGKSLITLSGFLSDLPMRIEPELDDLEGYAKELSHQITICSIAVRRFTLYSMGLMNTIVRVAEEAGFSKVDQQIDLLNAKELQNISRNYLLKNAGGTHKKNIEFISHKNLQLIKELNQFLFGSLSIIIKSRKKIERIRRNGFIANYMGANISIESAYIRGNQKSFEGLVQNIKSMVNQLNEKLDTILEKINVSETLLTRLIQSGIIR